ncbi:tripartite tricarboxylate transporter substrate binding protein [Cupriavidus taiwanensis]|uniref:Bug family tripartite tricarboxylate transporter substrate binding protein n=1 Tax=Cupriavidus taiwanensis TaxID=164546 RepID=UPI0015745F3B|nr:tripartite tricarboxylate transporter substrate binding protein [Cupriavidus taiwanensis]NSX14367.1 tripartite tricarboxylate transporter substrate binding protein [Cupriavidus taiwanensis]
MLRTVSWRRRLIGACFLLGSSGVLAEGAYPHKPVTLVVPFVAGGMTDVMARQLAATMQKATGQPVLVENRPGAGGIIGAEKVARAQPDGYTLLVTTTAHVVNPAITKRLPYDTERDFAPIALLASTPSVLVVNPSVPAKNLQQLFAFARRSGSVSYGSAGTGGTTHLSGALLASRTGAPLLHVPYKGTAAAVNDLLGGQIQASFVDALTALKYIQAGKLTPVAVTTKTRAAVLPDVPTVAEQGVPGYETEIWIGFYGPARLPAEIQARLNDLARSSMNDPPFQEMLQQQGTTPGRMPVPEFQRFVSQEIRKWDDIVKRTGIEPQ